MLPSSKGSLSAQPLRFASLPGEQMAAPSLSAVGGRAGQAGGASSRSFRQELAALAPGHWYPGAGPSQGSRKSPSSCTQGASVCLHCTLSPDRPPKPPVAVPGEVLVTAQPCAGLTAHRSKVPSPQPWGASDSAGAQACDLSGCALLLPAGLLAPPLQPRGLQECKGGGSWPWMAQGKPLGLGFHVASGCVSLSLAPRPSLQASSSPQKKSLHGPQSALEPEARAKPSWPRPLESNMSLLGAGSLSQEWVGRRGGPPRQGPCSVWPWRVAPLPRDLSQVASCDVIRLHTRVCESGCVPTWVPPAEGQKGADNGRRVLQRAAASPAGGQAERGAPDTPGPSSCPTFCTRCPHVSQ